MMHEQQLVELGLTENEVKIYILLLENGSLNPSKISQKLGLHRGYVYDTLRRMQEKQVVNSILKKNKKFYQATNPNQLAELFRLRFDNFQRIVPVLMEIAGTKKEETKVELHKGRRVYRTLLKDMMTTLHSGGEAYLFGIDEEKLLTEIEPTYLRLYLKSILSRKITEKIIVKKGGKKITHDHLSYRELDESYVGTASYAIYKDKVAIFVAGNPHELIVIENKEIAETYRLQFALLWEKAN